MTQEKHGHTEITVGVPDAVATAELAASGGYGRLLANGDFRNLWVAQTISGVGDWLVVGLLIPLVTELTGGSSMAVAGIMIAKIVPSLLLSSLLGVLVDRYDRRSLMIACDLFNAVLCLGLLFAGPGVNVAFALTVIYGVTFLMEIANLLMVPAKNALIPALVDERDLAAANGLSYTTQQASMLVGLIASGAIVAAFVAIVRAFAGAKVPILSSALETAPYYGYLTGSMAGVALDSISFLLSAFLIWRISVRARPAVGREPLDLHMFGREVRESFVVLKEQSQLRGLLITIGLAILGGGAIVSVGLVYVQQNLVGGVPFLHYVPPLQRAMSQGSSTFMMAFLALGMFLGAVIVPRIATRVTLEALFVSGVGLFGASMLGFSTTDIYWVAAVFGVASGFCVAQVTVAGNTYIAETVADEMRGRVFTALESVLRVALLVSMVVVAPLGDLVSGLVQRFVETTGGNPAKLVLTGSRITLILASSIVLAAAFYASRAVQWRRGGGGRE